MISNEIFSGPPITGPCGASYRPSENFAISSGHQPFVVDISVEYQLKRPMSFCIGTIVTVRHVLTAGCSHIVTYFRKPNDNFDSDSTCSHLLL